MNNTYTITRTIFDMEKPMTREFLPVVFHTKKDAIMAVKKDWSELKVEEGYSNIKRLNPDPEGYSLLDNEDYVIYKCTAKVTSSILLHYWTDGGKNIDYDKGFIVMYTITKMFEGAE